MKIKTMENRDVTINEKYADIFSDILKLSVLIEGDVPAISPMIWALLKALYETKGENDFDNLVDELIQYIRTISADFKEIINEKTA